MSYGGEGIVRRYLQGINPRRQDSTGTELGRDHGDGAWERPLSEMELGYSDLKMEWSSHLGTRMQSGRGESDEWKRKKIEKKSCLFSLVLEAIREKIGGKCQKRKIIIKK